MRQDVPLRVPREVSVGAGVDRKRRSGADIDTRLRMSSACLSFVPPHMSEICHRRKQEIYECAMGCLPFRLEDAPPAP
eukprot:SAG11_NODE_613_length_8205_cov_28.925487_4_plen_78_part_00